MFELFTKSTEVSVPELVFVGSFESMNDAIDSLMFPEKEIPDNSIYRVRNEFTRDVEGFGFVREGRVFQAPEMEILWKDPSNRLRKEMNRANFGGFDWECAWNQCDDLYSAMVAAHSARVSPVLLTEAVLGLIELLPQKFPSGQKASQHLIEAMKNCARHRINAREDEEEAVLTLLGETRERWTRRAVGYSSSATGRNQHYDILLLASLTLRNPFSYLKAFVNRMNYALWNHSDRQTLLADTFKAYISVLNLIENISKMSE